MHVRDLVGRQQVVTVGPQDEVARALQLLFMHEIGGMPVVTAAGTVVGFIGERDIVRAMNSHLDPIRHMLVQEVMRAAVFCDPDDSAERAMHLMTNERARHLVVTENGNLLGVVSVGDMLKFRLGQLEMETAVLRDYLAAKRASL